MFLKNMKLIFLCLLIGCTTVLCVPSPDVEEENTKLTTEVIPSSPTVPSSSSSSTTPTSTTTKATPTTTPTTPTTTTTPTIPTTTASTTPKTSSTTTTTLAPTTAAPTTPVPTTPAPTTPAPPTPKPDIGKWNTSCIILQMSAQLNFTYPKNDQKNATVLYNLPSNAVVHDSECTSNASQNLVLQWGTDAIVNTATFQFDKNGSNINLEMILFKIQTIGDQFPNSTNETVQLMYRGNIFEAPLHMSYHCTREQKYNLTSVIDNSPPIGFVKFSNVQVEAFKDASSSKFSTANDCDASNTSDFVPIAVGIALCGLIITILIAYLAARYRSNVRGYMSF